MKMPQNTLNKYKYFWDINFNNFDIHKAPIFVIQRILEYGDEKAIRWMLKKFDKKQIKQVIIKFRGLSPKSINYWALFFSIPKTKILCLKKSYQKMQKGHWPY